jgi:hypothetical protein
MKLNTLNRQLNELIERLDSYKTKHNQPIIDQINKYTCKVRDIEKLMNITKDKVKIYVFFTTISNSI